MRGAVIRSPGLRASRIPMQRNELLSLLGRPGSAGIEGWSEEGLWRVFLPWPREIVEIPWRDATSWPSVVGALDRGPISAPSIPEECPFIGGWVGYISYEAAAELDAAAPRETPPPEPPAWFAFHDSGVAISPGGRSWFFGAADDELARNTSSPGRTIRNLRCREFSESLGQSGFEASVQLIRDQISNGNVYQVNLTQRFEGLGDVDGATLYEALTAPEPPRRSALLIGDDWSIASASPEILLRFDRRRGIADSCPIKGTVRRSGNDGADRECLLSSAKDAAEHLMIVDLVRNDLGRIARPGRVTVPEFRSLLRLEHVFHLESVVRASGLRDVPLAEILRALLPAGSITGAPKRAAIDLIRRIEPVPRGVYTGAIGFVDLRGRTELSVAIRTAVTSKDHVRYHAGGGIVWDSDPASEYREAEAKSVAFLRFLGKERCER
ncbi:MAG: anthranilate synthase component I family protein [Thermoanaerobaculia bacterium]